MNSFKNYGAFQVMLPNINYHADFTHKTNTALEHNINPQYQKILDSISEKDGITRKEIQNILKIGQSRALNIKHPTKGVLCMTTK